MRFRNAGARESLVGKNRTIDACQRRTLLPALVEETCYERF